MAGFVPLIPRVLGLPDTTYVEGSAAGPEVRLVYEGRSEVAGSAGGAPVVLAQRRASAANLELPGERLTWGDHEGRWTVEATGGRLVWLQDGLQLTLSASVPRDEAIRIAASVEPVGE
jgi:hypothetical protein